MRAWPDIKLSQPGLIQLTEWNVLFFIESENVFEF